MCKGVNVLIQSLEYYSKNIHIYILFMRQEIRQVIRQEIRQEIRQGIRQGIRQVIRQVIRQMEIIPKIGSRC